VKNSQLTWNSINKFILLLKLRNFSEIKIFKSPLLGKDGNEEWLIFAEKE
jgi:predicted rRNA methylase YqxC with S4 and FtsJ domains